MGQVPLGATVSVVKPGQHFETTPDVLLLATEPIKTRLNNASITTMSGSKLITMGAGAFSVESFLSDEVGESSGACPLFYYKDSSVTNKTDR